MSVEVKQSLLKFSIYYTFFTSFVLRECIYFTHEQHSKLYMCFLDGKQTFDRVWHLGMLYILHSCVDQTTFSAIRNMYDNTTSCVSNQGLTSDWFPILQGTRQGGNSSPYIYLVYIDGLIKEQEKCGHGLSLYILNMSCPTVADHMVLISLSRNGTDVEHMTCVRLQVAI